MRNGEPSNSLLPETAASMLPASVLYSTSARIGGFGLDAQAMEGLRALQQRGILGRAIGYANRQAEIPHAKIKSLRFHPVRLLSFLDRPHYYGVKKHYVDWTAARELAGGRFDFFHGWSGESVRTLRVAKKRGIPSLIEIPTWHRNKGKQKPYKTKSERERDAARFPKNVFNSMLVSRQQVLEEYDLADLIAVYSQCAAETFLAAGIPREKLFELPLGVDSARFTPGKPPSRFRAVYVGALIKRKGVHTLLAAWNRLGLKNAELVLAGFVHDEIKPFLREQMRDNVRLAGFSPHPEEVYRDASLHIFPSTCEGSAKVTYEAAACGLPQICTRESGDVVIDGVNGIVVPCDDVSALAGAILRLYENPALCAQMGVAARERVVNHFTWDHFRMRLMEAYGLLMSRFSS